MSDGNTIVFGSITYTHKAQNLLNQNSIKSKIEKVKSAKGCGYGLTVGRGDLRDARVIIKSAGIDISEVIGV